RRAVRALASVSERGAQRAEARHLAVAERGVRDNGGGDPDVGVLRHLSLRARCPAAERVSVDPAQVWCGMTDVATKNWYIVHTYSGFEKKVAESLQERVKAYGLQNDIGEVLIPTEDVVEMRAGKKVVTSKRFFPGYILVEMNMSDHAWHVVKNT